MRNIFILSVTLASIAFIYSCDSSNNPLAYQNDTHSRGKIDIYIEESYKPLFETTIYTFEGQFPKAHIKAHYCSEYDVIENFLNNKTKTIFMTRDFTKKEKAKLRKSLIEVRSEIVANDAVALIVHPTNTDTNMTVNQLKRILLGKETKWKGSKMDINVVFDQQNSANFNYLSELTNNQPLQKNIFAVKSNEEVINYVKTHPNAIGIIGVNWISDQDDSTVSEFRNGITVVGLSKDDSGDFYKPMQAFIHTKEYPLTRQLWSINKGSRSGLNTGFVNFLAGEKGQLIIHKSGLVSATAPIRMIHLNIE